MRFVASCVVLALVLLATGELLATREQPQQSLQYRFQGNQDQQPAPPQPDQQSTPAAPSSAPQSAQQPTSPNLPSSATPEQVLPDTDRPVLKRRPAKKPTHKKPVAKNTSGKVIVRNGGAKEGTAQLSPGISQEQQAHNRENTEQLLATTEANLKGLAGRQLTSAQQSMVEQIHTYIAQSKTASNTGDLNRAHTLAFKAHLLSDELAKK